MANATLRIDAPENNPGTSLAVKNDWAESPNEGFVTPTLSNAMPMLARTLLLSAAEKPASASRCTVLKNVSLLKGVSFPMPKNLSEGLFMYRASTKKYVFASG